MITFTFSTLSLFSILLLLAVIKYLLLTHMCNSCESPHTSLHLHSHQYPVFKSILVSEHNVYMENQKLVINRPDT